MDHAFRVASFDGPHGQWVRMETFFGHYDCRAYVGKDAWIDIGAGSLLGSQYIRANDELAGCVGRIGRYCEFSECVIQVGMEHPHDLPVNNAFGLKFYHRDQRKAKFVDPAFPRIEIGNNVIVSQSVLVLGGASIGDGAVIGAGTVLSKPAEPFGIYAGVPGRKIRDRMDPATRDLVKKVRWWDFSADYMIANMDRLQELAVTDIDHPRIAERPRFVVGRADGRLTVVGFTDGDANLPLSDAPASVQAYVAQAMSDGPYNWIADCWT